VSALLPKTRSEEVAPAGQQLQLNLWIPMPKLPILAYFSHFEF
jgi:hypothetical protein